MSVAHKVAAVILMAGVSSVWLRNVRRTADCESTVKWDHVAAASFVVYVGFAVMSGLGILYNAMLGLSLGWALGLRWAGVRIKRWESELHSHSGPGMIIRPLPLLLDCLIAAGCAALGVLLGLGTRVIVRG